ncbi:uncharacterized protein LOC143898422 isoform X1 [Temnothorax americanus]|uniref:uncharacterized protein LOC143898422 isoform X1 n=1 Tax=Temnothorax americanus TaxID=1964332 RepID=UPI004068211C
MICIETQYFSLNRILLLVMGLWPYKQSKLVRLHFIFFLSILTSAILFQFTSFLTVKYTSDFAIKVFSTTLFFIFFLIKYIAFAANIENVKDLLTQLQYTYNGLRDKYENIIIEKYSDNGKWYTITLIIVAICSVFALIVAQFWSNIYDVVLSRNVSESRHLLITTEYFIDQEKYFYLIVLHICAALCIGSTAMIAIGTMLIAYLQHTCGMFRISSYRIKRVMKINMLQNMTLKNENLIFKEIISAIDIHRQAMKLSELLVSKFEIMLFCLIGVGVISLSLNLFRIFQIRASEDNINECLFPAISVISCILYMFISNYIGQDVINHTNHVFITAYSIQWYLAPLHIQKIILFLLQRNAKNFTLGVGGLFIGSLECFATLVKASVSYFTVMYSVQ